MDRRKKKKTKKQNSLLYKIFQKGRQKTIMKYILHLYSL